MSRYRHGVAANGGVTVKRRRRGKLTKLPRERRATRESAQTERETTHGEDDGLGAGNGLPARTDRPRVRVGYPLIHEEDRIVAIYESLTWQRVRQARLFGFLVGVIVGLLLALAAGIVGMVVAFH